MKHVRLLSVLGLTLALLGMLAACTPGDLGNEEIAFVRNGTLWTITPQGANAFEAVAQPTPLLGYGISPNHQLFVFRTLDSALVRTAGAHLAVNPLTGLAGDAPGAVSTVGIDGGTPIPLILTTPHLARSNAWWSPNGTRLLYREGAGPTLGSPALVTWIVSQNDQPEGIARKMLPDSFSIPSINATNTLVAASSPQGIFLTTLAGTDLAFVQRGALPGHPLPASLERVLWQPGQAHPALLYASRPQPGGVVSLVLLRPGGQTSILARCQCFQFAWSPDGTRVLYSDPGGYTMLNLADGSRLTLVAEHAAIPYWSPDSQALLLDGLHTLTLVRLADHQVQVLLSDGRPPVMTDAPLSNPAAFLQPVANSVWNIDGRRFVFVTRGRTSWLGQPLPSGDGLYTLTLDAHDQPQGGPFLVDGNRQDTQPGWSYALPETSFLL